MLVNPATSYDRSHWRVVGSLVADAPGLGAFGIAATLTLATTVPDTSMVCDFSLIVARYGTGHKPWLSRCTDLHFREDVP